MTASPAFSSGGRSSSSNVLANLGYGGNALSSRIEQWTFFDDLTYRYSLERQTSFMSPYGSAVRPSSKSETGVWAPPDRIGERIDILLLPDGLEDRTVMVDWLGSTKTLDTHVLSLRRKLGAEAITTMRGIGYRFEAP